MISFAMYPIVRSLLHTQWQGAHFGQWLHQLMGSVPCCIGEPLAHQIILVGCVPLPNQVGELLIGDPYLNMKRNVGAMGEMDFSGSLASCRLESFLGHQRGFPSACAPHHHL